ncbi:P-loop containing nucleoside triphosphate hydrolase protein [Hygrophoropsis aurantiaca]|uniref:P-loop containing nucleoside triphosphate hydrolase protein n=1 Tax=Hygrophoropsis aurantiaca TaxID=72124 RepID=A0ACB7ZQ69_9AGAM|nr:P-loop containing nucleoside triphosphate hydrolase protein [Hygrophoropsis aurantiaca]
MSENTPSATWPPLRRGKLHTPSNITSLSSNIINPNPTLSTSLKHTSVPSPRTPLVNTINRKSYRNGYETKPQTPSYKPYALPATGRKRKHAFAFDSATSTLQYAEPLTAEQWNRLAHEANVLPDGCRLREFQIQCANSVVGRGEDVCVIAPTGAGKSMLRILPLLVHDTGISLIITPYTSLGIEGQNRCEDLGFSSAFVHSEQKEESLLEEIARGQRRIVFVCVEMLESPTFARILHALTFQTLISAIYVDEAHLAHESQSWRPAYTRVHELRKLIGYHIPLVAISATLPSLYRQSLHTSVGLNQHYTLINLGNYRPELITAVVQMEHEHSSFQDLEFLFHRDPVLQRILKTIVYCDDLELLTKMFWWFQNHLVALGLSPSLVDILHAGLTSEHQEKCLAVKGHVLIRTLPYIFTYKYHTDY